METRLIYVAEDGEPFDTEVECRRYERVLPFCKSHKGLRAELNELALREPAQIVDLIFAPRKTELADAICALTDLIRSARSAEASR